MSHPDRFRIDGVVGKREKHADTHPIAPEGDTHSAPEGDTHSAPEGEKQSMRMGKATVKHAGTHIRITGQGATMRASPGQPCGHKGGDHADGPG